MSEEQATGIDIIGDGGATADAVVANPSTDTAGTWMDGMSDEHIGAIQNKGWESASDMYKSYSELESFRGVPADQIMKRPGEGESWDEIYSQMGRPNEASEYVYNAPEGFEGNDMLEGIREVAFSKGMSAEAFTAITDKYDEILTSQETAMAEEAQVAQDIEIQDLKRELGQDFDKVVHVADQTAVALGFDQSVADALRNALGVKGMLAVMGKIADTMGEDTVNSVNNSIAYGKTNEQLMDSKKQLMTAMMADPTRLANYNKGIGPDVLEYNRLHGAIDYSQG